MSHLFGIIAKSFHSGQETDAVEKGSKFSHQASFPKWHHLRKLSS